MSEADKLRPTMNHLHNKVNWLNQMINNMDKEIKNMKMRDNESVSMVNGYNRTDRAEIDSNPDVYNYEFRFLDENTEGKRSPEQRPFKSSRNRNDFFSFFYPDSSSKNENSTNLKRDDGSKSKSATKEKPNREYHKQ